MFQRYVSSVFFRRTLQLCLFDVAYVSHIYCICFIQTLRMVFKCVSGVFFKCFISMFQVFQLPSDVCCNYVFRCFKSRSGVASLLLPPSVVSSLTELVGHPYERGMGDERGTKELRASGASEGAPYGRTLPPERDGRWAEGAMYIVVWEQRHGDVGQWTGALLLRW
jgi:hypothetical protein